MATEKDEVKTKEVPGETLDQMYPDIYYSVYPLIKKICEKYDVPSNPGCYPYPTRAMVEQMIESVCQMMGNTGAPVPYQAEASKAPGTRRVGHHEYWHGHPGYWEFPGYEDEDNYHEYWHNYYDYDGFPDFGYNHHDYYGYRKPLYRQGPANYTQQGSERLYPVYPIYPYPGGYPYPYPGYPYPGYGYPGAYYPPAFGVFRPLVGTLLVRELLGRRGLFNY